jgi:hypothetical protein
MYITETQKEKQSGEYSIQNTIQTLDTKYANGAAPLYSTASFHSRTAQYTQTDVKRGPHVRTVESWVPSRRRVQGEYGRA